MMTSLIMLPIMGALFGLAYAMRDWPASALGLTVLCVLLVDALLVYIGASTWRREEVMANL
jgi:hypothetical protein